jgi:hypothetical protein
MIKKIQEIFAKKKKEVLVEDPPGRTFKRVLTGDYFSCEKEGVDQKFIEISKQDKIDQIKTFELTPKFVRFSYEKNSFADVEDQKPLFAHVTFQKEVFAKKWNMLHVTEIAFTVRAANFEEFEEMAEVNLKTDFKDLTEVQYRGEERRDDKRRS